MRPPIRQQAPYHYIRRWPRARREQKKPVEIKKIITRKRSPLDDLHAVNVRMELVKLAQQECPPGYTLTAVGEIFSVMVGHTFPGAVEVTYRRADKGAKE